MWYHRVVLWIGFILNVIVVTNSSSKDPFGQQPRISVEDGHMVLRSAQNKNITILSGGTGSIRVNEVDFSAVIPLMSRLLSGSDDVNVQSLKSKVETLMTQFETISTMQEDFQQLTGNVSRLTTLVSDGTAGMSTSKYQRLRRRVVLLEKKLQTISTKLAEDDCTNNPCQNGGTCIDAYKGYHCQCTEAWEGPTCGVDVNECSKYAGTHLGCRNGATCYNTPGSYRCDCAANWYGIHCTENHDDCNSASNYELCGHGVCINEARVVAGHAKYRCICNEGWKKGFGPACDQDVNECAENKHTCSKNPPVQCINTEGSYHCGHCPSGYEGNGHQCFDINECATNNGGCSPLVTCENTIGSRRCGNCPPGYAGNGMYCSPTGVCSINRGGCHPLATCIENSAMTGTFRECRCPQGYSGSGEGLTGCVQEQAMTCASNPCAHGTCQMTTNSYYCVCFTGYTGALCNLPLDHCSSQPCRNGGTCNTVGNGYTCICAANFEGIDCADEKQNCNGFLFGQNGTLRYPLSPGQEYRDQENCVWIISAMEGQVINVTITAIHIEAGFNCIYDFLQIHDGGLATSRPLGRYCGNTPGTKLQSSHSEIYVWFHTDHRITGYGFTITWNATNATCGGTLEPAAYGAINSPGYPGTYPKNKDCYWHVQATPGARIQFHFATLRFERHENCSFDFLKIYDGTSETDPLLGEPFCTTVTPPPLLSSGAHALLHFHSDTYVEDTGFHITYASVPGVHGCGGTLTAPTGTISSPNYPDTYQQLLDCDWLIRLHPQNRVRLSFNHFQIESHYSCGFDYVEVYDGPTSESPLLGRYCGMNTPPDVISNSNQVLVKFHTDSSVQQTGFRAEYQTVCGGKFTSLEGTFTSPYFPDPYPHRTTCYYSIVLPQGNLISLQFPIFATEDSSSCVYDYVQVRDGASLNSREIGKYCGTTPPDPITSSFNELLVTFVTDGSQNNDGFLANYTNIHIGCGGVFSADHGYIHPPPILYGETTCNWIVNAPEGHVIKLTFETFVMSNCDSDYLLVQDSNGTRVGKLCGSNVPPIFTSTDNTMRLTFVSESFGTRSGFNASYEFLDSRTTCGGTYYLETGIIRSPGFPANYPHSRTCTWLLHAETGHQIALNVTSFHVELHRDCRYDYLEIRNGAQETSPLFGRYCGEAIPPRFLSHSNVMRLKFVSDNSYSAPGFEIFYDTATTGCGGTLKSPSGAIISPNYPQPYGHSAECLWTIRVSQGSAISIAIVDSDIEAHRTCQYDYVQIFDGDSEDSISLVRICNNQQNPGPIISKSNVVLVKFKSDSSANGRGFHLVYHLLCNNELTSRRGVIESPNFPNFYPHNHNCTWTITAPIGNNITLAFSHLFLERSSTCEADYLQINQISSREMITTELQKFCGAPPSLPLPITTSTNVATVRFVTDSSVSHEGFRLEYSFVGCGGEFTRNYGYFTSPNYPNGYPDSTSCIWTITLAPGSRVRLRILDMDLEWHSNCAFDYLKVYGGADEESPRILSLCHRVDQTTEVTSHGNKMLVHFYSDSIIAGRGFRAVYSRDSGGCGGRFTASESTILSPSYPSPYNANDECRWYIEVDPFHLVVLDFYEFSLPQSTNCTQGYVAVYDGIDGTKLLRKVCGEKPENSVVISQSNKMTVVLRADGEHSGKGFKAVYTSGCGQHVVADTGGEIKSPNYPNFPTVPENCSWIISAADPGEKVTLIFTNLYTRSGSCFGNGPAASIVVRDGDEPDSPVIESYCGTTIPPAITSQGSSLHITLASNVIFRATYGVTSSHCGGDLHALDGSFASPGYPNSYPIGSDCEWTIAASQGNSVELTFSSFNLAQSEFCNLDYLEIHEKDANGILLGKFCGDEVPNGIAGFEKLWIKFRSEETSSAPGFVAYYSLRHGSELNGTEGILESPGYHNNFNPSQERYEWLITVPSGYVISVEFLDLKIPLHHQSCWSSIKIYDGFDTTAPASDPYCGYVLPEPFVSHGSQIVIQQNGDMIHGKWRLRWVAVDHNAIVIQPPVGTNSSCWYSINIPSNSSINITSPGYPIAYENNMNCTWILRSSEYERVRIKFLNVSTSDYMCYYDKVDVYVAPVPYIDEWELNGTVCGIRTNVSFESPTNLMMLRFITDNEYTMEGFNATAETVCGGHLYGTDGRISSSDILAHITRHHLSSTALVCQYLITVRDRRTIQLTFDSFNLPSDSVCNNMFFMIRNGAQDVSPMLGNGKYCGSSIPSLPESTSNQILLKIQINSFARGSPQFSLRYQEISVGCGGHLYLNDNIKIVEIKSPNYPNPPPHPVECSWIIMSPSTTRMRVDFDSEFHMNDKCYYKGKKEYVELRDGGTESADVLSRYCGTSHPSSMMSTGNAMTVTYFTDVDHPGAGFKATVREAVCGGIMAGYGGHIESPNYPNNYSSSMECEWTIKMPLGYPIYISVDKIDVPPSTNCTLTDYLEIREDDSNGELVDVLCSNGFRSYLVASNQAYVKFISDNNSRTGTGFQLYYARSRNYCGDNLSTPSGTITSPDYPSASVGPRECYWRIYPPEGRMVTLTFSEFNLQRDEATGACINYLQVSHSVYSSDAVVAGKYCGNELPNITDFSAKITLKLKSHGMAAGEGFVLRYSTDKEYPCGGVLPMPSGLITSGNYTYTPRTFTDCRWNIATESSNTTVTFKFDVLDIPGTMANYCRTAMLVLYTDPYGHYGSLTRLCGNMTSEQPIISSPFPSTFLMIASRISTPFAGIRGVYNTSDCGGIIYGEAEITSPGYPNNYSVNTHCHWIIKSYGQRIRLTTLDMKLEEDCKNDYVRVLDGSYLRSPQIGRFCGLRLPAVIESDYRDITVIFHSNEYGSAPGFKMTTSEVQSGCGGLMTTKSQVIKSPNYPQKYDNNVECIWTIELPPGNTVNVTFVDRFDIEMSTQCANDYLLIEDYNEGAWEELERKCGSQSPQNVSSSSTKLRLTFRSDSQIQGDGFQLRYTSGCGGHFTEKKGIIHSPNFPENYYNYLDCRYTVGTPQHYVTLKFDESQFHIEYHPNCSWDSVSIYGISTDNILQQMHCGTDAPPTITVLGPVIVQFKTDSSYVTRGFIAEYEISDCGGIRTDSSGEITTPRSELGYLNAMHCVWVIHGQESKAIVLKFLLFDIEYSENCIWDALEIYDGNSTDSPLIKTLCGQDAPPLIKSTSNFMTVLFRTDYVVTGPGFDLVYYSTYGEEQGCGGKLESSSEEIKSIDFDKDGLYEPNADCLWYIVGDTDLVILLTFLQFDLEEPINGVCNDYVEVKDGLSTGDPLIGKYCGNTLPQVIRASSNKLLLLFHSDSQNNFSGFTARYESVPGICGSSSIRNVTDEIQTLTSPNYPEPFPSHAICQWIFPSYYQPFRIRFTEMHLPCSSGYLQVHTGFRYYDSRPSSYRICGNSKPSEIVRFMNVTLIFHSFENTGDSNGFSLTYAIANDCSFNYTKDDDAIVNPLFPYQASGAQCSTIIQTTPGKTISVYFGRFYFSTDNCENANLTVYDGPTNASKALASFCGTGLPNPVFSTGRTLLLQTSIPTSYHYSYMYYVSYTTTDAGRGCGGTLSHMNGTFSSPLYPMAYNVSTECVWRITMPEQHTLTLWFSFFSLTSESGCETNYLEIYEGGDTRYSNRVNRLCGTDVPPQYTSQGSQIAIKLVTNVTNTAPGFFAHFGMNSIDFNVLPWNTLQNTNSGS